MRQPENLQTYTCKKQDAKIQRSIIFYARFLAYSRQKHYFCTETIKKNNDKMNKQHASFSFFFYFYFANNCEAGSCV